MFLQLTHKIAFNNSCFKLFSSRMKTDGGDLNPKGSWSFTDPTQPGFDLWNCHQPACTPRTWKYMFIITHWDFDIVCYLAKHGNYSSQTISSWVIFLSFKIAESCRVESGVLMPYFNKHLWLHLYKLGIVQIKGFVIS